MVGQARCHLQRCPRNTGKLVQFCEDKSLELDQVVDEDLQKVSKHLKPEVRKVLGYRALSKPETVPGALLPRR